MLSKETETYVVVIRLMPLKRGYYQVELGDADGEIYDMTVHEETVLAYRLIVGKELDEATFCALEDSKDYEKAYRYAIDVLSRRLYTEKEIRRKLYDREVTATIIDDVIEKLTELELLNDFSYATLYIENQLEIGKKSQRQIISELYQKGVGESIVDDLMGLFDQASERERMLRELRKSYDRYSRKDFNDFELRNKVLGALGRKGFDFYEAKRQYDFFIEDLELEMFE